MMVFFGHQSVGRDVIAGLGESSEVTHIVTLDEHRAAAHRHIPSGLTVVHAALGRNREPLTKLADFAATLQSWPAPLPDVALMKFCYVDIETARGAESLLDRYQKDIEELQRTHPTVRFAHCTVPLRSIPTGPYALARRLLGQNLPQFEANQAREWFNDRLRERYGEHDMLFDLARLEATRPEGRPCTVRARGVRVRALASQWTYDGGHLNQPGRTMAATAFLHFLHASGMSR